MAVKTLYSEVSDLKNILCVFIESAVEMKNAFDDFVGREHKFKPESKEYKELIDLYRDKGGLKGYLDFMGIK